VWRNLDPNNPAGWVFVCTCTKSKVSVTGLTSGTKYWFRARAKGGNDATGPWSDPATCFAP
jgi:chitodextrinase